jgi:hypothetical protein
MLAMQATISSHDCKWPTICVLSSKACPIAARAEEREDERRGSRRIEVVMSGTGTAKEGGQQLAFKDGKGSCSST